MLTKIHTACIIRGKYSRTQSDLNGKNDAYSGFKWINGLGEQQRAPKKQQTLCNQIRTIKNRITIKIYE